MKTWGAMVSWMRCMQTMPLLQRYLDGNLDEVAARRVAAHLEHCRRCGLEVSVYQEIKATLGRRDRSLAPETLERLQRFSEHLGDADDSASGGRGA